MALIDGESNINYYHNDQIGTPRELTNEKGKIVWEAQYKTWGNVAKEVYNEEESKIVQSFRFQGQYFDAETGLNYNRFRYYDADVGRFISQDPIGLMGGMNLYQYAPNPTGWVDPFGLASGKAGCGCTYNEEGDLIGFDPDGDGKLDVEIKALKQQGLSIEEAKAQIKRFDEGNDDGYLFHFTNKKGGNGIVDSGEFRASKNGVGGAGLYTGTTPTPTLFQKHVPYLGWGLDPGQGSYRVPYKVNKNTPPIRIPKLPPLTRIIGDGENVPLK